MSDLFIVIIAALSGSVLSFFCGFGLGTILLPAFMLFFPLPIAIAATALVHMANNVFKLFLVGDQANWSIIKTFGLLSVVGSLLGAFCLHWISGFGVIMNYAIGEKQMDITILRLTIALIIVAFAILEITPRFRIVTLPKSWFPIGGLVSGFFGGLSGHQGALRSAFLMKAGLSKEAFIGTRVVCACLVDVSRLGVYASQIGTEWKQIDPMLALAASLAAFSGAWLGNKWMQKTELQWINRIISVSLILFGIAFGMGLI